MEASNRIQASGVSIHFLIVFLSIRCRNVSQFLHPEGHEPFVQQVSSVCFSERETLPRVFGFIAGFQYKDTS